jgi:predicted NAD/FAD-binding protein
LPLARCSDDVEFTELDRTSAAAYLDRRGYHSARLRWYIEYACRDDYGLTLQQTSAWAMLFYFAARVSVPGEPSAPFLTWPEGNGRIVRHLTDSVGPRLKLGSLVTDVVPSEHGVDLSVADSRTGGLARYRADWVILAVPKFVAARILRPWRDRPPAWLSRFTYGAWMVANLHVRRRPKSAGAPFAWDSVLYDSPSLGYVTASHQTLADFGPTVLTYYQPLVDEDPKQARRRLLDLDHPTLCASIVHDLGRAHDDLDECVSRIDVWRWGHGMVRPVPGLIWSPERKAASVPVGRVHFAHSDCSGLALLEEAQYHGVRAAESVLRAAGRSFSSLLG